jgi:hypothetical protein
MVATVVVVLQYLHHTSANEAYVFVLQYLHHTSTEVAIVVVVLQFLHSTLIYVANMVVVLYIIHYFHRCVYSGCWNSSCYCCAWNTCHKIVGVLH